MGLFNRGNNTVIGIDISTEAITYLKENSKNVRGFDIGWEFLFTAPKNGAFRIIKEKFEGDRAGFVYDSLNEVYVKVLECPFCGSTDLSLQPGKDLSERVECRNCEATGPSLHMDDSRAIQAWNGR